MKCSLEEAFNLFFIPWCESGVTIVAALNRGFGGSEQGWIESTDLGRKAFKFRAKSWEKGKDIWFENASFTYEDSRAGLVPELVERKGVCFVLAEFTDGREILFALPRTEEEVDMNTPSR